MKAQLLRLSNTLRESYWFVPTIMALTALLLALTTVMIDSHAGSMTWTTGLPGLDTARPDGARSLLSAIGGSMIGVAGTTFSVTIAAVVYASGQYGPRLLSNFMSDRGNQVTLGTFIATFVYSLLVLRTIHSVGEGGSAVAAFVPQLALLIALVLVLCSIAVLIYFIHHVPMQIHINSVIEQIGGRLVDDIEQRFPARDEPRSAAPAGALPVPAALLTERPIGGPDRSAAITCQGMGYIQLIDKSAVIAVAKEHDMVVRLYRQPGDFVHKHSVLMTAWPADACTGQVATALRQAVALGSRRSALQDLRFLIDELVEIAARAVAGRQRSIHGQQLSRLAGRGAGYTGATAPAAGPARGCGGKPAAGCAARNVRGFCRSRVWRPCPVCQRRQDRGQALSRCAGRCCPPLR